MVEFDLNSIEKIKKKRHLEIQENGKAISAQAPHPTQLTPPHARASADRWTPHVGTASRSLSCLLSLSLPSGTVLSVPLCTHAHPLSKARGPCLSDPSPSLATAAPMACAPHTIKLFPHPHDPPTSPERLDEDPVPPADRPCLSFSLSQPSLTQ